MASGAVFDAIKIYLQGAWTTTPLRFENENYQINGASFVDIQMTGTLYGQQSIGAHTIAANRWDEEGVLWLHVLVPVGTGAHDARTYAKQLADLFRGLLLLNDSLEFGDAFIGKGQAGVEDGAYFRVSVYINWRRVDA